MYDEPTHIGYITMYSSRISPFFSTQDPRWDYLGETTRNASYLFYYLMSIPARIIDLITDNQAIKVIVLRLLMIGVFCLGLYMFRKIFLRLGASQLIINATIAVLVMIPMIAPLPGVISYDNPLFLITSILLYLTLRVVQSTRINVMDLMLFVSIGMFGSVIKYQLIALFAPLVLVVCYDFWQKWKKAKNTSRFLYFPKSKKLVLIVLLFIVSLGLFLERPVYNVIEYGKPEGPSCTQVLTVERCITDPIQKRNISAINNKPASFEPLNPVTYTSVKWLPTMIGTLIIVLARTPVYAGPALFYYCFIYGGLAVILLTLRSIMKVKYHGIMLFLIFTYVVGLMMTNYISYMSLGMAFAMNGRYLLPILPLFIFYVLLGLKEMATPKYSKALKGSLLALLTLLLLQGGGVATAILTIPESVYWKNNALNSVNSYARQALGNVVIERNPFNEPFQ